MYDSQSLRKQHDYHRILNSPNENLHSKFIICLHDHSCYICGATCSHIENPNFLLWFCHCFPNPALKLKSRFKYERNDVSSLFPIFSFFFYQVIGLWPKSTCPTKIIIEIKTIQIATSAVAITLQSIFPKA